MRKITWEQGRSEINWVLSQFNENMKDSKPVALIDNILWAVAKKSGVEMANALITMFELNRPYFGSHEYFDDDFSRNRVIHIDSDI